MKEKKKEMNTTSSMEGQCGSWLASYKSLLSKCWLRKVRKINLCGVSGNVGSY